MKMTQILTPFVLSTFAAGCASRSVPEPLPSGSPAASSTRSGQVWMPRELALVEMSSTSPPSAGEEHDAHDQGHHHHHADHPAGHSAAVNAESEPSAHGHDSEEPSGEVYTCPMHPEVTASAPGQCPKCGMNLEKKK